MLPTPLGSDRFLEAYRKDDPEAAARVLDKGKSTMESEAHHWCIKAIAHYCSKGNFRRAATHKQNLAELFEVELGDEARAAAAYEEAASWYESVSIASLSWITTPVRSIYMLI